MKAAAARTLLLLLAFTAVWFSNLEYRKLINPDEGRYAEIPREMVASGDWTTPRLNDIKYFEKPALQYWATAVAYTLFGEHQWTARLWSALTGFLGVFMVYFTGRQLFGARAGGYAALVLGSSLLWVLIAHVNTLDMGVSFFLSAAVCAFVLAQRDATNARARARWMLAAWAALALAVLSKGLIGLVLPGAALVLYILIERDWRLAGRLHLIAGSALLLALTVPWFVAVSRANPEFFHFFFIHEHFERFLTKQHGRYQPAYYFIPVLLAGMLPWTITLFDALARAWKRDAQQRFQAQRFLLVWAAVVFVFFSASSSKLVSYILPMFPALALLIGVRLAQLGARALAWQTLPAALAGMTLLALLPGIERYASREVPAEMFRAYADWLIAAAALQIAGAAACAWLAWRGKTNAALAVFALTGLAFAQLALSGHESLSKANSAYYIAQKIKPEMKPGMPFYSVNTYDQSLQFYLRRSTTMVVYKDELGFGIEHEPEKFIPDFAQFEKTWIAQREALALMSPDAYDMFRAKGLPMRLVARDTRRIIVARRPAASP
ncbi:MAG: glycosyltransferase family 39 protein [Burkholderiales bacterium]|nr:glycosyltransferase family 39 protein [Burkholderiales bacterium]